MEATNLLRLALKLHIYITYLTPSSVTHHSCAILRVTLLRIKDALFKGENTRIPQLVINWVVELEIFDIFDISNILLLDLSIREFVNPNLVLLVHINDRFFE